MQYLSFFLLSGFCIHYSNRNNAKSKSPLELKMYYYKRIRRIYLPYIFALIFSILIGFLVNPQTKLLKNDVLSHVFLLQAFNSSFFNSINVVLWTISVEMAFYILYPIYYALQLQFNSQIAILISLGVTLLSIGYFQTTPSLTFPQRYFFTNLWFGWCFGAWMCDVFIENRSFFKSKKWIWIVFSIWGACIISSQVTWQNDFLTKYILYILFWGPILIALINLEPFLLKFKRLLIVPISLGVSSYSLYLLHEPLIQLKNHLIHRYFGTQIHFLLMVLALFLIPIICYINYKFVEIPLIKPNHYPSKSGHQIS